MACIQSSVGAKISLHSPFRKGDNPLEDQILVIIFYLVKLVVCEVFEIEQFFLSQEKKIPRAFMGSLCHGRHEALRNVSQDWFRK